MSTFARAGSLNKFTALLLATNRYESSFCNAYSDQDCLIVENVLLHFSQRQRLVRSERRITRTRRADLVLDLFVLGLQLFQLFVELGRFLFEPSVETFIR